MIYIQAPAGHETVPILRRRGLRIARIHSVNVTWLPTVLEAFPKTE